MKRVQLIALHPSPHFYERGYDASRHNLLSSTPAARYMTEIVAHSGIVLLILEVLDYATSTFSVFPRHPQYLELCGDNPHKGQNTAV